uniref:Ovule protein n=1 Tax=Heterorhabditis bacteriophora TaxID=37862 RepID=A0A1I7X5R4_HETBA
MRLHNTSLNRSCIKEGQSHCLWYGSRFIRYNFLNPGESSQQKKYCQEIAKVHQEQQRLRPGSVKRKGPFFSMTMPNCISLYSADLSPTDYHSFKHLENFM